MTHTEKFEELKNEFNIDDNCSIVINESEEQVVYIVTDEEGNTIYFDFDLVDSTYGTVIDPADEPLYELEIQTF